MKASLGICLYLSRFVFLRIFLVARLSSFHVLSRGSGTRSTGQLRAMWERRRGPQGGCGHPLLWPSPPRPAALSEQERTLEGPENHNSANHCSGPHVCSCGRAPISESLNHTLIGTDGRTPNLHSLVWAVRFWSE